MNPVLDVVMIYARDMQRTSDFYQKFFGFVSMGEPSEGLIELFTPAGGAHLLIHQAAKSVKLGQVVLKLVFNVKDIESFKETCLKLGLKFGSTHLANGYSFVNAKDPDGNSISISSRAYRNDAHTWKTSPSQP